MEKTYKALIVGYYTLEFGDVVEKRLDFVADDIEEAKEKAQKWCEENTFMGGYDWHLQKIEEVKEELNWSEINGQ